MSIKVTYFGCHASAYTSSENGCEKEASCRGASIDMNASPVFPPRGFVEDYREQRIPRNFAMTSRGSNVDWLYEHLF